MVVIENPNKYIHIGFEKSHLKSKKYNAILQNTDNDLIKKVPFGASDYEHYKDPTGLGIWSHKNHNDKERRRLYRLRHERTSKNKYSSSWFSMKYLWK